MPNFGKWGILAKNTVAFQNAAFQHAARRKAARQKVARQKVARQKVAFWRVYHLVLACCMPKVDVLACLISVLALPYQIALGLGS